jgi:hypothetical protein
MMILDRPSQYSFLPEVGAAVNGTKLILKQVHSNGAISCLAVAASEIVQ